ncbi:amidase signature domain-containing protein [Cytidiella melzeri]|nr:amidase signature domain-containing protein [Cytidiella melzeri]
MLRRHLLNCRRINTASKRISRHYYSTTTATDAHANDKDYLNALVYRIHEVPEAQVAQDAPLKNLLVAIKDNICTAGIPTTCSSRMLKTFVPPYDATVVKLLREAGASIIGKTNCDEFGMGSSNLWSIHGPALNPSDPGNASESELELRSAGGSSGGSAAAVAAGFCDAQVSALGTDTGGSVRLPASYCGVVGFKPSYGIVSRWGVISYADSLDCVGILGKTVDYVRQVYHTVNKYDESDPTAAHVETRDQAASICHEHMVNWSTSGRLNGLRIGIPQLSPASQEYFPSELSSAILGPYRETLRCLAARGAQLVSVSMPSTRYALSAYYVIASAEASSNLARYDGIEFGLRVDPDGPSQIKKAGDVYAQTRSLGFGPEVQRRILLGTYALTADAFDNYFLQAQRVRKLVRADFDRVFRARNVLTTGGTEASDEGVDVLLHPSAIQTAPALVHDPEKGAYRLEDSVSSLDAYLQDVLTVPASLAGLPAMSVPSGFGEDKWPIGVSVVGQWGCDDLVLRVGNEIESLLAGSTVDVG